jgi:hypothetical protein
MTEDYIRQQVHITLAKYSDEEVIDQYLKNAPIQSKLAQRFEVTREGDRAYLYLLWDK